MAQTLFRIIRSLVINAKSRAAPCGRGRWAKGGGIMYGDQRRQVDIMIMRQKKGG